MKNCLNCNEPISQSIKYCPACGQKTELLPLNFFNIIRDFISKFFNVENKLWTTLKDIWIPAKLPIAYISGRRKPYYHPIRLFLFILFGFFAAFLFYMNDSLESVKKFSDAHQKNIWQEELLIKYDSLAKDHEVLQDSVLGLREKIFYSTLVFNRTIKPNNQSEIDSIVGARSLSDSIEIQQTIDSVNSENLTIEIGTDSDEKDLIDFTLFNTLKASDVFRLSPEELTDQHGNDNKYYSFFLVQVQKILKDLKSSLAFILGNGTWAVLLTVLLMSLFFKLLYIRKNYSFVEHLILQLNGHSRLLLSGLI